MLAGAALRLAVWWVSPPINAFDDHLEPIVLGQRRGQAEPQHPGAVQGHRRQGHVAHRR